jgi:hypothetical protein
MKHLIQSPFIELLKSRVHLSKSTRLLSIEGISKQWGISKITIYRYVYPHYRTLAQKRDKERYAHEKKRDKSKCQICKEPLKGHARCKICTILLHGNECIHLY